MRFYENRYAQEYERRLAREGYPGKLLETVMQELEGLNTVIDCGAGTGFFSIPLAMSGFTVYAVEPSPVMAGIMRGKLSENDTGDTLNIVNSKWHDWKGPAADGLICIHAMYSMNDHGIAIEKMLKYAGKRIIITKNIHSESANIAEKIRSKTEGASKYRKPVDVEAVLNSLNVDYRVGDIEQTRGAIFTDIKKEAEYYCYHLNLQESYLERVMEVISEESIKSPEGYSISVKYYDQIFIF